MVSYCWIYICLCFTVLIVAAWKQHTKSWKCCQPTFSGVDWRVLLEILPLLKPLCYSQSPMRTVQQWGSCLIRHVAVSLEELQDLALWRKLLWLQLEKEVLVNDYIIFRLLYYIWVIAFSLGKGLVLGASGLGLGALCFYGLGFSSQPGAIDRAV